MKVNELILNKELFNVHAHFSKNLFIKYPGPMDRLRLEEILDPMWDNFEYKFTTWVLKKTPPTKYSEGVFHIPLTWWDHLKLDFGPEWFVSRFPVKFKRLTYITKQEQNFMCPHDNIAWDKDNELVHIRWLENPLENIVGNE